MTKKPKILPPVYVIATFLIMLCLHKFVPIKTIIPISFHAIGMVFIVVGAVSIVSSAGLFRKMGTPVKPFEQSTVLVTTGFFKFTRNPMYLGMTMILIGVAIRLGTLSSFIPIPIFVWWIQTQFIKREEVFLEGIFGQQYLNYKAKVRRWL